MENQIGAFTAALRSSGRRLTGQRELLLELIEAHDGHLDAQELHRLACERDPGISLATVYRTLGLLRELGLVDELHLGEEHHHYEIRPAATHHHLVCAGCGQVIEFTSALADVLAQEAGQEYDFEISSAQIELIGLCAACRKAAARG